MFRSDEGAHKNRRIDSWKEIAAFFGRDERTVKRWEQSRCLPVHRVPGAAKSGVFAYVEELQEWLHSPEQERPRAEIRSSAYRGQADPTGAGLEALEATPSETSSSGQVAPGQELTGRAEAALQVLPAASIELSAVSPQPEPCAETATNNSVPATSTIVATSLTSQPTRIPFPSQRSGRMPRGSLFQMPKSSFYASGLAQTAEEEWKAAHTPEPRLRQGSIRDRKAPAYRGLLLAGSLGVLAVLVSLGYLAHSSPGAAGPEMRPARAAARGSADPQAEDFYLKGRYYWNRRTPESLNRAVDSFTQAIVHDPNDAEAYAGLADCYDLMSEYTSMVPTEAYPRAIAAATKAVALNDSLSEAHRALAFGLFYGNFEIPRAMAEYRRAIQLNPTDIEAHHWYATSMLALGRFQDALEEMERARQLNPTSPSILADRALIIYLSGEREAGLTQLKELERAEPGFLSPPRYLASLALGRADYPEFVSQTRRAAAISKEPRETALAQAAERGWARGGRSGMLQAAWQVEKKYFDLGQSTGFHLAEIALALGRQQDAITYLKSAYAARDARVLSIGNSQFEELLGGDPTFEQLKASVQTPATVAPMETSLSTPPPRH